MCARARTFVASQAGSSEMLTLGAGDGTPERTRAVEGPLSSLPFKASAAASERQLRPLIRADLTQAQSVLRKSDGAMSPVPSPGSAPSRKRGRPIGARSRESDMILSRRRLLAGSTALGGLVAAPSVARARASSPTNTPTNLPITHPMNTRARGMADAIKAETDGRVEITIFPSNQLGSDTDMLSQMRSGGVEFFTLSGADPGDAGRRRRASTASASPFRTTRRCGRLWTASSAPMCARRSPRPASSPWTRSGTTASARPPRRRSRSPGPGISAASSCA